MNAKPLMFNKIGDLSTHRHIPRDYVVFKDFILNQSDYLRTLWLPTNSRWSIYTNNHPKVGLVSVIDSNWLEFNKNNNRIGFPEEKRILQIIYKKISNGLADSSSIKYVIVPLQDKANDDDFFVFYGNDRNFYIRELNKIRWLKKIDIGTKELVVYENEGYRPHIYTATQKETIYKEVPYKKVAFQFKNPTEYKIKLKNIKQPFFLNFSEAFHSDWKLRVGGFNWFKVLTDKNYFLPDKYHFKNDATLNSFYIDPATICKTYNCKKNTDGSYDINLTLYFRPQSYMYLGLIISGTTLFACLSYLAFILCSKLRL